MKIEVNLGDEYKSIAISLPKTVPLLDEFNPKKIIGEATLDWEGDNVVGVLKVTDEDHIKRLSKDFSFAPAGIVKERDGDTIKAFSLHSVSITSKKK